MYIRFSLLLLIILLALKYMRVYMHTYMHIHFKQRKKDYVKLSLINMDQINYGHQIKHQDLIEILNEV
jgi:hypothetical protein